MTDKRITPSPKTAIARIYADAGFSPIRIAKRDKSPIDVNWQRMPIDAAAVDAWIDQGGNVGLRMGTQPDGTVIIALDEDEPGAIERAEAVLGALPETLTSRTGSGGQHRIFVWPSGRPSPGNRGRLLGVRVDVRGEGGQIVVAPSVHPLGGVYDWTIEPDEGPAILPDAWCEAIGSRRDRAATVIPTVHARATDRVARVAGVMLPHYSEGGRHELVRALGGWLARLDLGPWSDDELVALVRRLNAQDDAGRAAAGLAPDSVGVERRTREALHAAAQARTGETTVGWEALAHRLGAEDSARLESVARSEWWARFLERRAARLAAAPPAAVFDGANVGHVPESTEDEQPAHDPAVDAVIGQIAVPRANVYQRSGKLVTVTREAIDDGEIVRPGGAPTIRELNTSRLKEIIRVTCGPRDASLAGDVAARGEWHHIRPLDAIVSYPVMRRDGTVLAQSGYDAVTRTLAEIDVRVTMPDEPTLEDARAALSALLEVVCDFPFAGEGARAAWVALVCTIVARPAIEGPTPLVLLDANARGAGKTLLADVASVITRGEPAPRRVAPKTREEWDKSMLAVLLAGDSLMLIDNVTNMLVSDALDAVLTGTIYSQRVLGVSEERRIAVRTVFAASANNARLSTDLVRRSLHVRLESDREDPAQRTGYRYPRLLEHVRRERAALLGAALTIVRAYAVAGRPAVESRHVGSFESWASVVRDAIVWAGAADPVATQDALRESADVERDELRDLLEAWHALLEDRAVTTRELIDAATSGRMPGDKPSNAGPTRFSGRSEALERAAPLLDSLRGITPEGRELATHTIGNRLRSLRGQVIGGLVLRDENVTRDKVRRWRVVQL